MKAGMIKKIEHCGIVAILRGYDDEQIRRIGEALLAGGVDCMEITYRPEGDWQETARAIAMLKSTFGDALAVGAGTVLFPEQVRLTQEAGGQYIISPNTDAAVIKATNALGLVSVPGAFTPTECAAAAAAGADFVKLFPANALGVPYLKNIAAPLSHIRFLAVGGVTPDDIPAYVRAGARGFGIGGSLGFREAIAADDYSIVTAAARRYAGAVRAARQ